MIHPVKLNAAILEAFAGTYLSPRYDRPVATPPFHREGWEAYTSSHPAVSLVAPREHAKSTAFTFDFILAEVCFRVSDYVILLGSTEDMAAEQLSNIREELAENDDLRRDFLIHRFEQESKTDIIVVCTDGFRFRVLARGAEQKIRGKLWKGKRPNLMVGDDMEDDEQVESVDRRRKFRRWMFRAARQALSRYGRLRVHGTILHEDSLLSRLRRNPAWKTLFYRAHASYSDFSNILWPQAWPMERLRSRQAEFEADGDAAGYSQEFLNDPRDSADAYLREDEFLPMSEEDFSRPKRVCAAMDFALSKADMANRTSITIGGRCPKNLLHFLDQRVGRWDSVEWIDEMFRVQQTHNPECFFVEHGQIWMAVRALVYNEMRTRGVWLNIVEVPSVKDKAVRGRVLQKLMRARNCRYNVQTGWFEGFKYELLSFTGTAAARLDDQFDSAALLALGVERLGVMEAEDFLEEDEVEFLEHSERTRGYLSDGRSLVTGY